MPFRASLRALHRAPHRDSLLAPLRARRRPFFGRIALAGALIALLVAPAGCVSPRAAQEAAEATSLQVPVTAAFYPLAYLLEQVGGPGVKVFTLTKPGVEPHDLEPVSYTHLTLPTSDLV